MQPVSFASVGVLEAPPATDAPTEQGIVEPSGFPPGPPSPPPIPPRKRRRRGRAGAILLLTLVLTLIFGTGLFSGWEYAHASSSASTTTKAGATSTATTSSGTSLQAQQEAAIAKIEPAVVELEVTTAQGGQIGSGVIIDAQGDIVTNNHVVSGAQSITVVLSNGSTEQGQLIGTSASNDLAVVRIAPYAQMVVAQFGDSSKLVVGQLIGIPFAGAENSGTNTAADGINFAIPSNLVQTVVQQILQQGTA